MILIENLKGKSSRKNFKILKKVPSLLPLKSGPKKKSHPHLLPPPPFPCARAIYPFTLKLPPYTPYATSYPPPPFPRHLLKNQAKYREGKIVNHENHKSLLLNCTESKKDIPCKNHCSNKIFHRFTYRNDENRPNFGQTTHHLQGHNCVYREDSTQNTNFRVLESMHMTTGHQKPTGHAHCSKYKIRQQILYTGFCFSAID